jgi:hypothetical protein
MGHDDRQSHLVLPPGRMSSMFIPRPGGVVPPGTEPPSDSYQNYGSTTLIAQTSGNLINTAFPNALLLTSYTFDVNVIIISLNFSCSLINLSTAPCGIFVALTRVANPININGANNLYHSVVAGQNSSALAVNPTIRNPILILRDKSIRLTTGQGIGIYASMANSASNLLVATLGVIWKVDTQ